MLKTSQDVLELARKALAERAAQRGESARKEREDLEARYVEYDVLVRAAALAIGRDDRDLERDVAKVRELDAKAARAAELAAAIAALASAQVELAAVGAERVRISQELNTSERQARVAIDAEKALGAGAEKAYETIEDFVPSSSRQRVDEARSAIEALAREALLACRAVTGELARAGVPRSEHRPLPEIRKDLDQGVKDLENALAAAVKSFASAPIFHAPDPASEPLEARDVAAFPACVDDIKDTREVLQ